MKCHLFLWFVVMSCLKQACVTLMHTPSNNVLPKSHQKKALCKVTYSYPQGNFVSATLCKKHSAWEKALNKSYCSIATTDLFLCLFLWAKYMTVIQQNDQHKSDLVFLPIWGCKVSSVCLSCWLHIGLFDEGQAIQECNGILVTFGYLALWRMYITHTAR